MNQQEIKTGVYFKKTIIMGFCFYIACFAALTVLLSFRVVYGSSQKGEDCSACHEQHNNEEYKQLNPDAINSGKISCFTCHSAASGTAAPDKKREFAMARSSHPVSSDAECLICHELNQKHNDGYLDTWPDLELRDPDPEDSHVYSGAKINNFCLSFD